MVQETSTYAKIGAFLRKDQGRATVDLVTSVNEPLRVEASDSVEKIDEITVRVNVTEDKGVNGSRVYQKTVTAEQFRENGSPSTSTSSQSTPYTSTSDPFTWDKGEPGNDFKTWCKNTYDQLEKRITRAEGWGTVGLIIASLAFAGVVAVGAYLIF